MPAPDLGARLASFLVQSYARKMFDARFAPDERLAARMEFESFILSHGPPMLREVQKFLNGSDEALRESALVAEWLVSFVSSLEKDWLTEVPIVNIERLWNVFDSPRFRPKIVDLIARLEWTSDPSGAFADSSRLVRLFGDAQPERLATPLHPASLLIVETLFERVKGTSIQLATSAGSFATYCLRVIRYCFADRYTRLQPSDARRIRELGGELTTALQEHVVDVLRLI